MINVKNTVNDNKMAKVNNSHNSRSFDWSKALCFTMPVAVITLASALFTVWTNGFWVDAVLLAPSAPQSAKVLFVCLMALWGFLWFQDRQAKASNHNKN